MIESETARDFRAPSAIRPVVLCCVMPAIGRVTYSPPGSGASGYQKPTLARGGVK